MKVAFTGTQAGLTGYQLEMLIKRLRQLNPSVFIHGGCVGADDEADQVAVDLGIPRFVFPQSSNPKKRVPDEELRKRVSIFTGRPCPVTIMPAEPPLERNPKIVKAGNILIACPKEAREVLRSGTWATIRFGRRHLGTTKVEIIEP